jgi:GNAT superfamily N-acetyltransferase
VSVRVVAADLDEYETGLILRGEMSPEWDEINPDWREGFREFFLSRQALDRAQLFLAYDGAEAVGMCVIYLSEHYRTPTLGRVYATLHGVYVRPRYRRRGIGRELTQAAIEWARMHNCYSMRLRSSDDGQRLYESLGFQPMPEMELLLR